MPSALRAGGGDPGLLSPEVWTASQNPALFQAESLEPQLLAPEVPQRLTPQQQVAPRAGEVGRDVIWRVGTKPWSAASVAAVDFRSQWYHEGDGLGVQGLELGPGSSAAGCGVVQKRPSSAPSACLPAGCGKSEGCCKGSKVPGTQEA